ELPEIMAEELAALADFSTEIIDAGFSRAVVLGMGGSSLIAEVWAKIFNVAAGSLPVTILDSTHPLSVAEIAASGKLETTLFLVASKSGGTLESLAFFNYFYQQIALLKDNPGLNFIALTDPGSKLEKLAQAKNFRKIFSTPADVGGRYSALTLFGLVPAALLGLPVVEIIQSARVMAEACAANIPATENPALKLGAFLGEMVLAGRDKLSLVLSPSIKPFAVWIEQLIAESTGKSGQGLVPIIINDGDELPFFTQQNCIAKDSLYLFVELESDDNQSLNQVWSRVQEAGEPTVLIRLNDLASLGQEIWRFEMATAAIGAALNINPFDQPDVEAAKIGASQAMVAWAESGRLPEFEKLVATPTLKISGSHHFAQVNNLASALESLIEETHAGDYIALMVYLPQTESLQRALNVLQKRLQKRSHVPVTLGFGPRFLHSTGQLHKGDGNHGLFLQISGDLENDLALPGSDYSFATLIAAQMLGDYSALLSKDRRVLALHWSSVEVESELTKVIEMI
ncbi:hypothetical protein KAI46_10120, partial [bacterium]|nr:hypothetical protein [bacterium]